MSGNVPKEVVQMRSFLAKFDIEYNQKIVKHILDSLMSLRDDGITVDGKDGLMVFITGLAAGTDWEVHVLFHHFLALDNAGIIEGVTPALGVRWTQKASPLCPECSSDILMTVKDDNGSDSKCLNCGWST